MRYFLAIMTVVVLLLIFVGCVRRFEVDQAEYKNVVTKFCEPCGGVRSAFINEFGQEISCIDGTSVSQHFTTPPTNMVLGLCK